MRTLKQIKIGSWVHAVNPTEEEIKRLIYELELEEGLIRDGLDTYEVPFRQAFTVTVNVYSDLGWLSDAQKVADSIFLDGKRGIFGRKST